MTKPKKPVAIRENKDGKNTAVKFAGDKKFTSMARAVAQAKEGKVPGYHAVEPKKGDAYLRANPDGKKSNNLDELPKG